ncbi:hypothetical protein BN2475_280090 [Paraburkholderia ribeironis]|uniref:Uncharacterized protein n=1 Tax=Paraburkholderia ribeironis TaxID=1247936 RepID=A0A1N7S1J4_9BURK|nr:hypothetical protein [Paraburkholderia ribeironis]SIT41248.1 hypothetical protein BN2475_280090 [Paraburkholderia ribeironis]
MRETSRFLIVRAVLVFEHGAAADVIQLIPLALAVITASVVVHAISATPLMNWYRRPTSGKQ